MIRATFCACLFCDMCNKLVISDIILGNVNNQIHLYSYICEFWNHDLLYKNIVYIYKSFVKEIKIRKSINYFI